MTPVPAPTSKVAFDKIVSALALAVAMPLFAAITVCILLESLLSATARGGVVHTEVRISEGRRFTLYKFRILTPVGEQMIRDGAVPKRVENDPANLTIVGSILKKLALDDLPQLVTILAGRMSLIGPRPLPVGEYEHELCAGNVFRSQLRAGLSGPSQVMKGTTRRQADQTRAELEYAELLRVGRGRAILRADLRMLAQTFAVVVRATGE